MTLMLALLQAAPGAGQGQMIWLLAMIAVFVIIMWMSSSKQKKQQKAIENFRNSLTVGQEVCTVGGIYGTVRRIDDTKGRIRLEVSKGVEIEVDRNGISAETVSEKK